MQPHRLWLQFIIFTLVTASEIFRRTLVQRSFTKLRRLEMKLEGLQQRLDSYRVSGRAVVAREKLHPGALLFYLNLNRLLEYIRLCNRVSLIGQEKLEPIPLSEHIIIDGHDFRPDFVFRRGFQQISGYLLISNSHHGKVRMIATFAGTSSKLDVAHILFATEGAVHDAGAYRGIQYLVYKNIAELHEIIAKERMAGREVELMLAGHSLGGSISFLALYQLKKQWEHDPSVQIQALNAAGPFPFKPQYSEEILKTVGYNSMLSIYRKADYIYKCASAFGLVDIGPTLYLQDKVLEGLEDSSSLHRIKETFGKNHYVGHYVEDLERGAEADLWEYLELLEKVIKVQEKIHLQRCIIQEIPEFPERE